MLPRARLSTWHSRSLLGDSNVYPASSSCRDCAHDHSFYIKLLCACIFLGLPRQSPVHFDRQNPPHCFSVYFFFTVRWSKLLDSFKTCSLLFSFHSDLPSSLPSRVSMFLFHKSSPVTATFLGFFPPWPSRFHLSLKGESEVSARSSSILLNSTDVSS